MRNLTGWLVVLLAYTAAAHGAPPLVRNGEFATDAKLAGWTPGTPAFRFADDDGLNAAGCVLFTGPAPARAEGPSQEVPVERYTEYVLAAALK
ncbi:MAG: hypothetical protein QHJ73_19630, partial [Armatimonadota bacterium]|nr:hypothetical protein [Armatimonadota bacterium]